jgi:hypothetical protein
VMVAGIETGRDLAASAFVRRRNSLRVRMGWHAAEVLMDTTARSNASCFPGRFMAAVTGRLRVRLNAVSIGDQTENFKKQENGTGPETIQ